MRAARVSAVVVAGLLVVPALGAPAYADPPREELTLTCDGTPYEVVVKGNGEFTPAHATSGHLVFVPLEFGPATFTVTDPAGNVVPEMGGTDPGTPRGGTTRTGTVCTYTLTFLSDGSDPELPPAGYTATVTGQVTAKVVGKR